MDQADSNLTRLVAWIVEETGFKSFQVENTIALLREGGTVPFIARYRKERTGELDEVAIRTIDERLAYFTELEERKLTILRSVEEQGKLTPELRARIEATRQKNELEDLYLPYKPKRRTKATIARERGLEPLAEIIVAQEIQTGTPEDAALPFLNPDMEVADAATALSGAGHIVAERISEDADIRSFVRGLTAKEGVLASRVAPEKRESVTKYEMYYYYREPLRDVPSHRMLAMRRGEKEEVLFLDIVAPVEQILAGLKERVIKRESVFKSLLGEIVEDSYKRLIAPSIEVELRLESKERADDGATRVFAENLRNLLLASPAGGKRVLGIDPGLRTGCKMAAVDGTGRLLGHGTIYPHTGGEKGGRAGGELLRLLEEHGCEMIAIGNGTAGRETEQFVKDTLADAGKRVPVVMVSEAGASVYSASEIAREEFPDLDLTVRGAISIARRLQDPLAELVKIDPKSIGVGQYQHDVNQGHLKRSLDAVVESCVNYVGVDLNTASWALLSYVAGMGPALAKGVVRHRDVHGPFPSRQSLMGVPRFGAKAFEQAAGFLRIREGSHPLDNSAVHPERYRVVESIATDLDTSLVKLLANPSLVEEIDMRRYVTADVGLPTLRDILAELQKPGRDPREAFTAAEFRDDVREIGDLKEGMVLQGVVTNVTAFGAFVDVGVHQDGLVHLSHLSDRYVKDPHDAVRVGQVVRVKVLAADAERNRISLSIREAASGSGGRKGENKGDKARGKMSVISGLEKAGFRVRK
jgi:uncharacterized protein